MQNGSWAGETAILTSSGREVYVSQVLIAHKNSEGVPEYFSSVMRDMTERRQAEEALRFSQQKLLETSRLAGMAEVATGVLHNVGNVLNSVNVSAGLVVEKLRRSKVSKLSKAAALLTARNGDLGDYLTHDPNGQKLPGYLAKLSQYPRRREYRAPKRSRSARAQYRAHQGGRGDAAELRQGQRRFRNPPGGQLVEDAIAMNIGAFERHGVDP